MNARTSVWTGAGGAVVGDARTRRGAARRLCVRPRNGRASGAAAGSAQRRCVLKVRRAGGRRTRNV
eukprot:170044-Chlamydomonas_euryale.AAC.1